MIKMFALIKGLLQPRFEKIIGQKLYESCVTQSRQPTFYLDYGVEDQKGARFEMLNLHIALIINRLRHLSVDHPHYEQAKDTAQALFDHYLLALDSTMREDGVGDLSVPKKMKKLTALIYTRFKVWDEILDADISDKGIEDYLIRTVYAGTALDPNFEDDHDDLSNIDPTHVSALATYVKTAFAKLNLETILGAKIDWPHLQPSES